MDPLFAVILPGARVIPSERCAFCNATRDLLFGGVVIQWHRLQPVRRPRSGPTMSNRIPNRGTANWYS